MSVIHWLPLSIVAGALLLLVVLLRHRKFVQIRALWFSITFGDRPPLEAVKKEEPVQRPSAPRASRPPARRRGTG
jgi:hypothetical protein